MNPGARQVSQECSAALFHDSTSRIRTGIMATTADLEEQKKVVL